MLDLPSLEDCARSFANDKATDDILRVAGIVGGLILIAIVGLLLAFGGVAQGNSLFGCI